MFGCRASLSCDCRRPQDKNELWAPVVLFLSVCCVCILLLQVPIMCRSHCRLHKTAPLYFTQSPRNQPVPLYWYTTLPQFVCGNLIKHKSFHEYAPCKNNIKLNNKRYLDNEGEGTPWSKVNDNSLLSYLEVTYIELWVHTLRNSVISLSSPFVFSLFELRFHSLFLIHRVSQEPLKLCLI